MRHLKLFFLIVFILTFVIPSVGQAKTTIVEVYINGSLEYSPNPVYLKASALYSDGTVKDITYSGTWESSNNSIATVHRGKVEFQNKTGNVTITVSYGGKNDSVGTEVVDISDLKITTKNLKYSEKPVQLKVEGRYNDGELEEITDHLIWTSTNPRVAKVDSKGLVTFTGEEGEATIVVMFTSPLSGKTDKDEITVTVSPEEVDDDKFEETKAYTLKIDGNLDPEKTTNSLKAYKLYEDDSKKTLSNDLIDWTSSNPYVAKVDENGKVTFTGKPGHVTITARYKNRKDSVETFVPTKLEELIINETLYFTPYYFKNPPKLTVTGKDNGGKTELVYNVEWTSSNKEIASIDGQGQIIFTGKPGSVTFTATKDGLNNSVTCIIPEKDTKSLKKIFITQNLFYSEQPQELKTLAFYGDGSLEDITSECRWSSSNQSIATVENAKVFFTGASGLVEIMCSYQGFSDKVKTLVTVPGKQKDLNSIKFADHHLTYADNGKLLQVYGIYSDNSKKPLNNINYHSFHPNIVKVVNNRIHFTGHPGKATIEAEAAKYRDTLEVEVIETAGNHIPLYIKILGNLDNFSKTKSLKAIAIYPDGKQVDVTKDAVWNTTNNNIAMIVEKGKVEFLNNGPVRISASYGNQISFLSNKAYYQFGKVTPIKTSIIPIKEIKGYAQSKLSKNLFLPVPHDIYGHWAQEDIELARRLGWMGGYPDGSMGPDNSITRGEFASLIERALHLNSTNRYIMFTDINNHWAKQSIAVIANLGIIPIDKSRIFRPDDAITREEMAQILANLIEVRADSYYAFIDVPPDHPSATAIANVSQTDLMSGVDSLHFKPDEPATRAQALAVLLRLLKTDPEMEGILNRY